jgi:hypothetical protein
MKFISSGFNGFQINVLEKLGNATNLVFSVLSYLYGMKLMMVLSTLRNNAHHGQKK